jgi:hypothetical protein
MNHSDIRCYLKNMLHFANFENTVFVNENFSFNILFNNRNFTIFYYTNRNIFSLSEEIDQGDFVFYITHFHENELDYIINYLINIWNNNMYINHDEEYIDDMEWLESYFIENSDIDVIPPLV